MKIRVARGPIAWFLRKVGRWGITLPPRGIYILPEHEHDYELIRHEMVHWRQAERLGAFRFYVTYLYLLARYGYWKHPMEGEARG